MSRGSQPTSRERTPSPLRGSPRGDAHTNTVEGFYSVFKRGMKGVYQHCAEKHLHRYVAEFDFRTTIESGSA